MSKLDPQSFAVPAAPVRTPVREESALPFVGPDKEPQSRLSVDIPSSMLRRLKVLAAQRGVTIRELVLAVLERDGSLR